MEKGLDAQAAIAEVKQRGKFIEYRQVLVVDCSGQSATYSGSNSLGIWSEVRHENVASGGNLLANRGVPQAIVDSFLGSSGHLGDRLISAMRAGLKAGGESGPVHSAGLIVVDKVSWPVVDLRCDWTDDCPIEAIAALWDIYKPQLDAYVQRALNPVNAPSYGVSGNK
jgi:uncharacterized Ntn-hydrolase superfamily protein